MKNFLEFLLEDLQCENDYTTVSFNNKDLINKKIDSWFSEDRRSIFKTIFEILFEFDNDNNT